MVPEKFHLGNSFGYEDRVKNFERFYERLLKISQWPFSMKVL